MRFFNTAGPCHPERHYMVPAAERLPDARRLINQGGYFVVHAPRQTGKTTTLRELARELRAEGRYAALHTTCEEGEPAGDDYVRAQQGVLERLRMRAEMDLPPELRPPPWPASADTTLLGAALRASAEACPRPLVLFFDEIDALRGEGLRSVLRQLRAGYTDRPEHFPWSIVLCGLRDVRDYKIASGGDPNRIGSASPFNIKVVSRRLRGPRVRRGAGSDRPARWSTIGSANLDSQSLRKNLEANAVIEHEGFAAAMERMFLEDLEHCEEVTAERWERRSWLERAASFTAYLARDWL